jgi:hypothetical protein
VKELTEPVLGLELSHAVRVEQVVEGHAQQVCPGVSKVPLSARNKNILVHVANPFPVWFFVVSTKPAYVVNMSSARILLDG